MGSYLYPFHHHPSKFHWNSKVFFYLIFRFFYFRHIIFKCDEFDKITVLKAMKCNFFGSKSQCHIVIILSNLISSSIIYVFTILFQKQNLLEVNYSIFSHFSGHSIYLSFGSSLRILCLYIEQRQQLLVF
jgi:hypothetical protein